MVSITFYRKDGCWLCEHAEELLNGLEERWDLRINKVDITSSDELYELYRFDIPVVEFRDGSMLNGRIKKREILGLIEKNR